MNTTDAQNDVDAAHTVPLLEHTNPVQQAPQDTPNTEEQGTSSEPDDNPATTPDAGEQERTNEIEELRREHASLTVELTEATSRVGQYETEIADLRRELDLTHVAYEHGVPRALLQGTTRDEMEQFAAALKAYRADRPVRMPVPSGRLKSGANLSESTVHNPREAAVIAARANF